MWTSRSKLNALYASWTARFWFCALLLASRYGLPPHIHNFVLTVNAEPNNHG